MKKLLIIFLIPVFIVTQEYAYSLQDYNTTSETYGLDVWNPEYSDFITLHYFSSQGWAGWTSTFGQLSNFQNELRDDDGYENVVIIAVGQTNISSFNSNFTNNSDLPLVMDAFPSFPIRAQFGGQHKEVVILNTEDEIIGSIFLNNGLNTTAKNYIRNIIEENYDNTILGDMNSDSLINIQDVILLINAIMNGEMIDSGDMNSDGTIDVLDIVLVVNIILN